MQVRISIQGGITSAVSRVGDLNDVHRSSSHDDRDTETKDETTGLELTDAGGVVCGGIDDGTDDNGDGANEHATLAAELVNTGTNEGQGNDRADLVHGSDDSCPDTVLTTAEKFLEVIAGKQSVQQRTVVAVHGGAAEADQAAEVEDDAVFVEGLRRLLEHSLVEGLIALDFLDGRDIGLLVELSRTC